MTPFKKRVTAKPTLEAIPSSSSVLNHDDEGDESISYDVCLPAHTTASSVLSSSIRSRPSVTTSTTTLDDAITSKNNNNYNWNYNIRNNIGNSSCNYSDDKPAHDDDNGDRHYHTHDDDHSEDLPWIQMVNRIGEMDVVSLDLNQQTIARSTNSRSNTHNKSDTYLDFSNMDTEKYPIREVQLHLIGLQDPIVFNPMVSLYGIVLVWSVVIWTVVDPVNSLDKLLNLRSFIALHFTWLFVGSKAFFFFFLMYIWYKYGHIKLGYKDDQPDFSLLSYICIIFATGVATGFFVYSVAEPLWHQKSHFYAMAGYRSQDEIDMFAINLTINNWAISGWIAYAIVAVCMSLAAHRFHLPFTARSCFYPIFRDYTWGWIGDFVDGMTIVITIGGICTSLGLGALEIVSGLIYLGWVDPYSRLDQITSIRITAVWVITIICTASTISGVHGGIKLLSLVAIALGLFLVTLILFLDDTKFLLNLFVQSIGYYLQTSIFQLNFWTDAFGQLREGSGRAVDGKASEDWWMDAWTVFYLAWWISWSGFVGLMVARVSRGRTVGELIFYSLIVPIVICTFWFSVWGGIGLRQSRQAMELEFLGENHYNNSAYFLARGSEFCYDVPQTDVIVNGEVIFTNLLPGITPVCQFDSSKSNTASFNVLYSFSFPESFSNGGYGPTLAVFYIVALTLFFVTSSDSGSLIVDNLASNGSKCHHWVRRMFWSVTQGALATALIYSGGDTALRAVQAVSIVCGLPYIIFLLMMVQCITLLCKAGDIYSDRDDYTFPDQAEFEIPVYGGIFNIVEYITSCGNANSSRVKQGMHRPKTVHVIEFMKGVVVPFVALHPIVTTLHPTNRKIMNRLITLLYIIPYYGWIAMFTASWFYPGLKAWSSTLFVMCGIVLGIIRSDYRQKYRIRSNVVSDVLSSMLMWPQVVTQMRLHEIKQQEAKIKDDDHDETITKQWNTKDNSDSNNVESI